MSVDYMYKGTEIGIARDPAGDDPTEMIYSIMFINRFVSLFFEIDEFDRLIQEFVEFARTPEGIHFHQIASRRRKLNEHKAKSDC